VSPSNILHVGGYAKCPVYKLSDFGTATPIASSLSFGEGAGPYIAPEVLTARADVGFAADIWSLGAVMFEIVTRRPMPRDPDGYAAIREGAYDLSVIDDEFAVVRAMLERQPSARPTAEELLEIPQVRECFVTSQQQGE
jgi:serine/threonine-protein kinase